MSVPFELPGYRVLGRLGRGAMGDVLLAEQQALQRRVAIKRIHGVAKGGDERLRRLRTESKALARISHPNVVPVYDLVIVGSEAALIMGYVPGPSLRHLLASARFTPAMAVRVLADVAAGLEAAARVGVVHRDVKPANVLIRSDGVAQMADFGLARLTGASTLTRDGQRLGTPVYMAPEQVRGERTIDARTDVYALGIMAYELLLGRPPFPLSAGDVDAVLEAHLAARVPEPCELIPGFPVEVQRVLLNALEKQPSRRPASAGAFWSALERRASQLWPEWPDRAPVERCLHEWPSPRAISTGALSVGVAATPHADVSATDATTLAVGHGAGAADDTVDLDLQGSGSAAGSTRASPLDVATIDATVARDPWDDPLGTALDERRRLGLRARPVMVVAMLLALLGGVATGATIGLLRRPSSPPATPPVLAVESVAISVDPPSGEGRCPQAVFTFRAVIRTNAASGTLAFRWTQPDGQTTALNAVDLAAGTRQVHQSLQFTFTGGSGAAGAASLQVTRPHQLDSKPVSVRYLCP